MQRGRRGHRGRERPRARRRARRRHRRDRRPGRSGWPAPRRAAACRRPGRTERAEHRNVENAQGCARRVDEGFLDRIDAGRQALVEAGDPGAGKTGHRHRSGLDDAGVLRVAGTCQPQAGAEHARAIRPLPAASVLLDWPADEAKEDRAPRLEGMLLLPWWRGKNAGGIALPGAKHACPALSPFAICTSPGGTLRRVLRWVNAIGPTCSAARPSRRRWLRCMPDDPGDPQHSCFWSWGASLPGPHHCGAWRSVAAGPGKVHRNRRPRRRRHPKELAPPDAGAKNSRG